MPWKRRPPEPLERENAALKTVIIQLRREVENKQRAVSRFRVLVRERSNRIDALRGQLEAARAANQRLDQECEHWARLVAEAGSAERGAVVVG
jgi:hypothetical protein